MRDQVFEFGQARKVHFQLRVAPGDRLAQGAAAEAKVGAFYFQAIALGHRVAVDQFQQPPRLRRQFVQAAAKHVVRDLVGQLNIGQCDLDVFDGLLSALRGPFDIAQGMLYLALVLVNEGDGVDQGKVLFMVASEAGGLVGEGQESRVGVEDGERF